MRKITFFLVVLIFGVFSLQLNFAQGDQPSGQNFQFDVPANIQSLQQQIKLAEDSGDMTTYNLLRNKIIEAWKITNPEVAKFYNTVPNDGLNQTSDGAPVGSIKSFKDEFSDEEFESSNDSPTWSFDKQVMSGKALDISMDVSNEGHIYLAVAGGFDGASTADSILIYKSTDGGQNWSSWSLITASTRTFDQIELMCLDLGTTDNYILVFFKFNDGWFRVGRKNMDGTGSWQYYTIVGSGVQDFAVGRDNSVNKRVVCVYDSSTYISSVRCEPNSYGSVWQDKAPLGSAVLGKDVDLAYGWNGAVYATFNGLNSGNLYVQENTNYSDPANWQSRTTVVSGSTDTTRRAEIIASRENQPNNFVTVVFEKQVGSTYDLYAINRDSGNWDSNISGWVLPSENKWPSLYIKRINNSKDFRAAFEQSGELNVTPRVIKYKGYNGTSWSQSTQISDLTDVTGLQKPEVADIDGSTPIIAYVGSNYYGVYFDNASWVTDVTPENLFPESYSLQQNYPNPFNPNTKISFSIPEQTIVKLKIFNSIGQEVAALLNTELAAGNHTVDFNAASLSSGVYFYRIETPNFTSTKKMILMK